MGLLGNKYLIAEVRILSFSFLARVPVKIAAIISAFLLFGGSHCYYPKGPQAPVVVEKLFVISLKSATKRRQYMEEQAKKLNFPSEDVIFIDAVDGKTKFAPQCNPSTSSCWGPPDPSKANTRLDLSKYSGEPAEEYETTFNDWKWKKGIFSNFVFSGKVAPDAVISPLEYALIASAINVWQKIVNENISWAIVVEDDAEFKVNSWQELVNLGDFNDDAEYIQLFTGGSYCLGESKTFVGGTGTVGYAISKKGAEKALRALTPAYYPLDVQLFEYFRNYSWFYYNKTYIKQYLKRFEFINAYCRAPEIVGHSDEGKNSTIDNR